MGYAESVRALQADLGAEMLPPALTYGCDNIRSRNRVAAHVLRERPDATHVLWWDDDQWPQDTRIVRAMLATGEDLIGAPYTSKLPPLRWVHQRLDDRPTDERGVLEVRWVGFGFTLTSRACLERMAAAARPYADARAVGPNHPQRDCFGLLYYQPPGTDSPEEQVLLSEDQSFCERWRIMGGRVMIYVRAGLVYHAGPHSWSALDIPHAVVRNAARQGRSR